MAAKVVLVVAAHPDDEVLGCGATVAKLKRDGWRAVLMHMTAGVEGRAATSRSAQSVTIVNEQNILAAERIAAAAILGFDRIEALTLPDNRMDTVSKADIAHVVAALVAEEQPDLVLTHHPGDYNWDHAITFDAVMMGARSCPGEASPSEIWCFEVLSSSERGWARGRFQPTVYVDIADTFEKKHNALAAYRSELKEWPHPRSLQGIDDLSRKRGVEVGIERAECFELVRRVIK